MKKLTVVLVIVAAIVAGFTFWKPSIEIGQIKNIRVKSIQMDNIKLELIVPVKNSNLLSIKLQKVDVDFFINGVNAGKVNLSEEVKIPANEVKELTFPIEIHMQDMLSNFVGLLSSISADKAEIHLKGTFTIKTLFLTKDINVDKLNIVPLKK